MSFPDDSFDIVYAPYLISVVPDPVQVAREMYRVCRPRRPHRDPEPLQEHEPAAVADRDR
jgi:SAM-dependent methyltransferase